MIWVREAASASLMSIVKKIEEVIHMLKGIGVSDGIGIGRVMILAEQSLDYTPKEITDIDAELARYREAVDKFCDNTVEQANAIRQSTGDKEAEILEGHIAIIRDPFMGGEIENLIKANQCAEAAVDQICKMFIDMFSATGDDLTMQRAADVRDIRDGILGILLGVQEVKISDAPAGTVLVPRIPPFWRVRWRSLPHSALRTRPPRSQVRRSSSLTASGATCLSRPIPKRSRNSPPSASPICARNASWRPCAAR